MATKRWAVSFEEVYCDDGIPEETVKHFSSEEEAYEYYRAFENWELTCYNVQMFQVQAPSLPLYAWGDF